MLRLTSGCSFYVEQWLEHFPTKEGVPPNFILKTDYPKPEGTTIREAAMNNSELRKLLLELPSLPPAVAEIQSTISPSTIDVCAIFTAYLRQYS